MRWVSVYPVLAGLILASTSPAQSGADAPYAGQQDRAIKSMDPGFVQGLRQGAGLGFAKSAELNGWPGPLHVLELAEKLELTDSQRVEISAIRAEMLAEAVPLGEALIAAEGALERLFQGKPDRTALHTATSKIGEIRARLRTVHLLAHLKTAPLLTRHQKMIYARERGYADAAPAHDHGGAHK